MADLEAYLDKRGISDEQMQRARERTADLVESHALRHPETKERARLTSEAGPLRVETK